MPYANCTNCGTLVHFTSNTIDFFEPTFCSPCFKKQLEAESIDIIDMIRDYRDQGERVDEVLYQAVKAEIETLRQALREKE